MPWGLCDLLAVVPILFGIALQMRALFILLGMSSLRRTHLRTRELHLYEGPHPDRMRRGAAPSGRTAGESIGKGSEPLLHGAGIAQ
ncbi:hypothetical protein [Mesorhizobium sp.]|uniref:hypothetical protein n=1 Tax=Mesorhizobium sp. TaxID=1871066 RepID=UPI00257F7B49|nr:hypothetical protein [Mesorhizobium sp.]